MSDNFIIYIYRLKDGQIFNLHEECPSQFLDVQEDELAFLSPVKIDGKAYLTKDHLVLQLHIAVQFVMPCSICNEKISIPMEVKSFYHVEPLENMKSPLFNYREILREAILLQLPAFAECQNGQCPEREALTPFLKKEAKKGVSTKKDPIYYPFADL